MQNQLMVAKLLLKEKEKEIKEEYAAAIEKVIDHYQNNASRKRPRTGEASGGAVSGTHVVLQRASDVVPFHLTVKSLIKIVPKRIPGNA